MITDTRRLWNGATMIKIGEIWGSDFVRIADELEKSTAGIDYIILDFLNEIRYVLDHPSYDKIFNIAHKNNIPIIILTPYLRTSPKLLDMKQDKYKNTKIIHWETFWFNRTFEAWKSHDKLNAPKGLEIYNLRTGENPSFKYPYITLNNISKRHRCLVMDLLAKYNLIEKGAISWRDINHACNDIRHTFTDGIVDSVYMGYRYKYWKPKRIILDQDIHQQFLQETLPIEFNQSFMQLVTESDDQFVFYSEKTVTPILLNKLFLVASAKGHHTELKNLGFQLYDEIFDYSFDNEPDESIRYEGLIENVNRISTMPPQQLEKLHTSVFEKLVYNKKHALNLVSAIPPEVTEVLNIVRQENKDSYRGPLNMFL